MSAYVEKQQQLCEKTLWINHLLMDVEPWCYRWIGFDGMELWLGWGTEHLTVLKTLKDAARNHLWKIHLHLICLVPFCAQVEMDPILARISLFLSSPSGVQKCPKVSKYLSTQTGHLTPPPPQVLSLSGLPCLPWVVSNTLFCFYQLLQPVLVFSLQLLPIPSWNPRARTSVALCVISNKYNLYDIGQIQFLWYRTNTIFMILDKYNLIKSTLEEMPDCPCDWLSTGCVH